MRSVRRHTAALNLPTLRLEGGLFLPDVLAKAAHGSARLQTEADYCLPKGLQFKDEIGRAFQIACAQWRSFAPLLERIDFNAQHAAASFITELLRDALAYPSVAASSGITLGEGSDARRYPITHWASASGAGGYSGHSLPIVVAPHTLGLDVADERFAVAGSGSRKKTPFQLAQELLNASPEHQWALVTNGKTLRLLRDAATLTRPSYLEFDLQDLLAGQRLAEFAFAWRLLHASRAGLLVSGAGQGASADATAPASVWEAWREAGQEEGTRVRNGLRAGVTQALITLGHGFVQHPANQALRQALQDGSLSPQDYFAQLLRLIYRYIFTFSVEERGLIPAQPSAEEAQADPAATRAKAAAAQAYAEGYALARLRDLALRRRARTRFDDLWQGVKIVFHGLGQGQPRLGLPALGGLFAPHQCPHLDAAQLTNADLLAAMHALRWAPTPGGPLAPIDYRNMGTEELGSVYESLLELVPEVDLHARRFGFVGLTSEGSTAGNDRKLTGSYYTPDSLVQELIRSALDPVIAQRLAQNPAQPVEALLAIRVIDPACGSGHFLLAAARRLAEKLAALRAPDGAVTPPAYRHALREVIGRCIFGVDRNPMAVELARTALWLEGFEEGRPLGFLDHHLQVGDALLGLTDLKALELGIPKDAFKPLSGDSKEVCKLLAKANAAALKDLEKKRNAQAFGQLDVASAIGNGLSQLQALETLPDNTTQEITAKEATYLAFLEQAKTSHLAHAADLLVGAFLLPKREGDEAHIPTSATLYLTLLGESLLVAQQGALAAARTACAEAQVLHWPLTFPQVFAGGGFDCVLGNPPWERIKLQEEEFFATRHPAVANASNKAERSRYIEALRQGTLAQQLASSTAQPLLGSASEAELRLYAEFISARRTAEATSVFMHVAGDDGGRYPLTGVGDVNTYALFSEAILQITAPTGRAGFIVPTGIATDDSTKAYFGHISQTGRLASLYDIENREAIFPAVHRSYKFCLLTLGVASQAEFVCFAAQVAQLADPRRRFTLTPGEFRLINPNTLTCPVFRSHHDAELTKKLYRASPVLLEKNREGGNPWGVKLRRMFDKSNASNAGELKSASDLFPEDFLSGKWLFAYEGDFGFQFDHRYKTFEDGRMRTPNKQELNDPGFSPALETAVLAEAFENYLERWEISTDASAFLGFRRVARSTDERTIIATILPLVPSTYGWILTIQPSAINQALLCANYNSLVLDYCLRNALSQPSIPQGVFEQLPILPPHRYAAADLAFIVPRVLELTYTAYDLAGWAHDLGHDGPPFAFVPERRAQLRADLDAYYARLYGLTRDELRYILDPADVLGQDYPSETFRVLKNKELREFGEYRTQRLVLAAWDAGMEISGS